METQHEDVNKFYRPNVQFDAHRMKIRSCIDSNNFNYLVC